MGITTVKKILKLQIQCGSAREEKSYYCQKRKPERFEYLKKKNN
jgi:hypothetical protein